MTVLQLRGNFSSSFMDQNSEILNLNTSQSSSGNDCRRVVERLDERFAVELRAEELHKEVGSTAIAMSPPV